MRLKKIPGLDDYLAGDDGHIYSVKRNKFIKLKENVQSTGNYYTVAPCVHGKNVTQKVHRLVCLAFNGVPGDPKATVSHLDGNWKNNDPLNLIWESIKENTARKKIHGTDDAGVKNSRAKFSIDELRDIRRRLGRGDKHKDIAKSHSVDRALISAIAGGIRYKGQGYE